MLHLLDRLCGWIICHTGHSYDGVDIWRHDGIEEAWLVCGVNHKHRKKVHPDLARKAMEKGWLQ